VTGMRALSDIVVLDLTHMLSGPYGTMLLADLGARTIKVEPPGTGEGTRKLLADDPENSVDGMGAYFLTLNRNKESVCIDLKRPQGRELFYKLVEKADVVFDNFGAGVTKRLQIDHPSLSRVNPRIVTCSVTGFGSTGPSTDRPAFDMVAQGMGGGMSITGEADGRAVRAGIPIGDLGGGLFGALGVLAALHERAGTGLGQHVDVSMLDAQISLLNYMATMHLLSGKDPGRLGNGHFVHCPYDTYRTRTRDLIIAIITDDFWVAFARLLGDPVLADPAFERRSARFAAKALIDRHVQAALERETCEHWLEKLSAARIPHAPVNNFSDALSDPQVLARGMVVDVQHPGGRSVRMPGNPVKLSRTGEERYTPPPLLGSATDAVLHEFAGLSRAEVATLRESGVVG
jgi:crotonobetainyl-CoA:carnitine CoA-transferase CaiB-like acyl-CoA transferase